MPDGVKAGTAYVDVDANLAKLNKTLDQGVPKAIKRTESKNAHITIRAKLADEFSGKNLGKRLSGTFGKLTGLEVGGGVTALGAGLEALAAPAERAKKQLEATFSAAGQNINDYKKQIDSTEHRMENFAHTNADTDTALRVLTTALGSPTKALADMGLVANIAAAKHISLADAAALDVKAHAGATKVFKQFGITVTKAGDPVKIIAKATLASTSAHVKYMAALVKVQKIEALDHLKKKLSVTDWFHLRDAQNAAHVAHGVYLVSLEKVRKAHIDAKHAGDSVKQGLAELAQKLKGQAAASVDSFSGKLEVWKTKIQDVAAKWGEKLGPILTTAGPIFAGLATIMTSRAVPAMAATAASEEATGAAATGMLGPIGLIIAGIAALAAGVIYAYTHFKWFRDTVDAVGRFFRDTFWPILQRVFADVKTAFDIYIWPMKEAFHLLWIGVQWAWDNVGHPVFHAVSVAAHDIGAAFSWLKDHAVAAFQWIGDKIKWIYDHTIGPVVGLISGAANAVGSFLGGGGSGPTALQKHQANVIARNAGQKDLYPGYDRGGVVPGRVGQPQLAVVHGGEEVLTPKQRAQRAGMTINNHFHTVVGASQVIARQEREARLAYAG